MQSLMAPALLVAAIGIAHAPREAVAQYLDTDTGCKLCHRTAIPQNDFCRLPSAEIWQTQDKHNKEKPLRFPPSRAP